MEWEISESYRAAKEAAVRRKYDQSALFLRTALSLIERRLNGVSTDDSNRDQLLKVRDLSFSGSKKVRRLPVEVVGYTHGSAACHFSIIGSDCSYCYYLL